MTINKFITRIFFILAIGMGCVFNALAMQSRLDTAAVVVPLGGNAFVGPHAKAIINARGLSNWTNGEDVVTVYVRPEKAGSLNIGFKMRVPSGESTISVKTAGHTLTKTVAATGYNFLFFGEINIDKPGYLKVELQGLSKTGNVFADIDDMILIGTALKNDAAYVKDNKGNFFYWGHRGPSVHLNYTVPDAVKNTTEWFYNEVTVPVGNDVIGSYFMADGFTGGYFGMQVNSADTRRILFSVWSPYTTDDPKTIPESLKVKLLKKGEKTHGCEFGGEGSGGQSYLTFPWVAGKTYCFLIHAQGDIAAETTIYTAYFKPLESDEWILVASFKRPQSGSYLKGLHSFLENFDPKQGDKTRWVFFGNQWIVDIEGKWYPLNDALFTGDNTAKVNYRKDYAGGVQGDQFYLRNCGFFDDFVPLKTSFTKTPSAKPRPQIDFSKLP
ncbi:DUF3472 domain-containing protein [Mucilaginibacter sp. UYCu711]|uniref:DUF3472 domain-containing protein n=1 Tax=Mucilaginibacter sp. UYCu711 TaxID=3156339 RepID=UPI003D2043E5